MKRFEIQNPLEFLRSFNKHVAEAKQSVLVQTMIFDPGELIDSCVETLIISSSRGVDVRINVDWLAEIFFDGWFNPFPTFNKKRKEMVIDFNKKRLFMYNSLQSAGVKITVTNKPNRLNVLLPAFRRCHIKMYVVDTTVAWIGGVNFSDCAFDNLDFMVKITDPSLITALIAQFPRVNTFRPKNDYTSESSSDTSFFVDSGRLNSSIIYRKAIEMIDASQKTILFVSQFVPDGSLLEELLKKSMESNVNIIILTSNKDNEMFTKFPYALSYKRFLSRTKSNPYITLIHFKKKVHIKLLLVDSNQAMFGSHNFSQVGGILGTEEIALHTTNQELINDLQKYVEASLGKKLVL